MKDDRVYLAHIRDAVERILKYTSEGKSEFDRDEKTQDAVVRNLEIIGEATTKAASGSWMWRWGGRGTRSQLKRFVTEGSV